jgi:DNA-binding SARP family transcriptional activator
LSPSGAEPGTAGPSIQTTCFGGFRVSGGGREITPTGEEGGQYKAWEILAFLACQPDGTASKDQLLAAIWPDTDPERGANRMRIAMTRLRSHLTRKVPGLDPSFVRTERDGTCRLDTTQISSDVHRFVALCEAARNLPTGQKISALEKARALYGGDLLSGRGARFYEWLHERDESGLSPRERYREMYLQITQQLATLLRDAGEVSLAIPLYRSLLKVEPTLEDVARDLYRCHHKLGDLSSLIREDRQLRQALREAFDDPSDRDGRFIEIEREPETVQLFERLRAELEARVVGGTEPKVQRIGRTV